MSTNAANNTGNLGDAGKTGATSTTNEERFDDLVAAGVDERTIAVARALAVARRDAPASLMAVRWAAVADHDREVDATATAASATGTTRPAPKVDHVAERRREDAPRRRWGREGRWVTQVVVGAVGVVLVAVLWAWVVPWLEGTATIRRIDGPGDVGSIPIVPPGPAVGEWTVAAQLGGETLAIARDGPLMVAGRGRHVEAYDLSDRDVDGRPRFLGESAMLPGRPTALAVVDGAILVGVDGQHGLWVLDAPWRTPTAVFRHGLARPLKWRATVPTDGPISRLVVGDSGAPEWIVGIMSAGSQLYRRSGPVIAFHSAFDANGAPTVVHTDRDPQPDVYDVAMVGPTVYGATDAGIAVIDVSGGTARIVAHVASIRRIEASGMRLFAIARDVDKSLALCFDVRVADAPKAIGTWPWPIDAAASAVDMSVSGNTMAITVRDEGGESGRVDIVDMTDPAHPQLQRYRNVGAAAPILRSDELVLGTQDMWGGWQLDVLSLATGDWKLSGTSPPPMDTGHWPLLASPLFYGVNGWDRGALALSSLDVAAAHVMWPASERTVATRLSDGPPLYGTQHLAMALGATESWQPNPAGSWTYTLVAQATRGDRAAALLVREKPGRRVDIGLVVWSAEENPGEWRDAGALGDRIAWVPFDRPDEPGMDAKWPIFDRIAWKLVVNDRYAVAVDGYKDGKRVLVYDVSAPEHPRLLADVPDIELEADEVTLLGSWLYTHSSDAIVAYELDDPKHLSRIVHLRSALYRPIGRIAPTEQGLLVLYDDDLELWPYDREGGPDAKRAEKLLATDIFFTEAPGGMAMVVDGNVVFIATMTLNHSRVLIRTFDLATRQPGQLVEVPAHGFDMTPQLAVAKGRIYLSDDKGGMFILERRPRVLRGDMRPSATRDAPRSGDLDPH